MVLLALCGLHKEASRLSLNAAGQSLFRSYGRLFAEFLDEESLVSLGLLALKHLCRFAVRSAYTISSQTFLVGTLTGISSPKETFHSQPVRLVRRI